MKKFSALIGFLALIMIIISYAVTSQDKGSIEVGSCKNAIPETLPSLKPSNEVFCCPGPIGYVISAGYKSPGEAIGFRTQNEPPQNFTGTIVFTVYKDSKLIYAKEGMNVMWKLPKERDVTYKLVVYALNDSCDIVDVLMSEVIVPGLGVMAKMSLDKELYKIGEEAVLTIENTGRTPLFFGVDYVLYKWDGKRWVKVDIPYTFIGIGYFLQPGKTWNQTIPLNYLEPGHYKIVKKVSAEGTRIKLTLRAEFDIIEE